MRKYILSLFACVMFVIKSYQNTWFVILCINKYRFIRGVVLGQNYSY
ncbi:hypothetical protein GGR06_003054 [Bacteroides reticulotermitis]|uniref:Uncharacterized protein n=1 Tax=Bacteroides reticulotermitis TaxID=1133319 RepID=A0A840D9M4_9BACE|nr:hypothetical protein [Bacteroides reticulotermitis]